MFGGLEVKEKSSKDEKDEKPAASAFSFMAATPAPAPPLAAEASSGFSFMTSAGGGAAAVSSEAAPSEQSSAFSFMAGATPTPAPPSSESLSAPSSGFGFLQTPVPPPAPEPEMTAPSSSFSFMSTSSPAAPESKKSSSTGLGPTPAVDTSKTAPSLSAPVGSGITFGGATAATKKPIKKRSRATKVGAARAAELPARTNTAPPRPSYPPETPRPNYGSSSPPRPPSYSETSSSKEKDTKEAANEAMQRAEEFLAQKMQQQDSAGYVEDYGQTSTPTRLPTTTAWARSPEDDHDYAAAKAAAEEAQAQLASGRPNQQQDSIMGRFFSRKTPWGGSSSNASVNNLSQHSLPTITTNETPAERMQREQEEIKRAVAERQLAMNQEEPTASSDEDDAPQTVGIDKPTETKPSSSPAWGTSSIPRTSSWTRPSVVAASPPAPPPKTPSEKFQDMLHAFEENVQNAMTRVAQMRDHHKGLLDERLLALAKERLATQSMAAAEAQQMQAAEAEDYDLADRLGAVIDNHAREKAELTAILDNIGRALAELDSQKAQVVGEVALCFERIKEELEEFQEEQQSNDKKDDTEAMARFASVAKQLSSEQSRLSSDEKHLLRDEKLVREERKELEASISEQTADLEKQRDSARVNLMTIEEEIEVLRRQLEAKEATAQSLRAEVEGHDADISKIRDKFSRQLTRVERKEASIKENRYEWEKEKIAHDAAKLAHEKEVEAHHVALVTHDALMEKLRQEINLADAFRVIVATEVVFEKTAEKDLEFDGGFAQLQADVVKAEAAVSEGKQILKAADAALNDLKEERDALVKQIPILEEIKTAAAGRRDFKAAGKASKQIKDATARLKECQEELSGDARDRKDAALEDLVKLEEDLKAKKAVLNEKEKEAGKAAMENVASKIKRLAETKKSVCGGAMDATGIQSVGAFVLNGQVEALMREGSAYGEKYGCWDIIAEELKDSGVLDTTGATVSEGKSVSDGHVSPSGRPADEVDPEVVAKFRNATRRLQKMEEAIDAAVARDDFQAADKLNEELEEIKLEWEAIELTEAEIKIFEGGEESEDIREEAADKGSSGAEKFQDKGQSDEGQSVESESDSMAQSSQESETTPEGVGGESGYLSEVGTEFPDDPENDSADGIVGKTDEEWVENSEDVGATGNDKDGPVINGSQQEIPPESTKEDDADSGEEADAEKDDKPAENGKAGGKVDKETSGTKAPEADDEPAAAENGR